MDIAISLFLVVIFLLPGVFFRLSYYSGEFSKESSNYSFFRVLIASIIPSVFLYAIWIWIVQIIGYEIDFVLLGHLFISDSNQSFENIQENQSLIAYFHTTLYLSSFFLGFIAKWGVRKLKLDINFKILRYKNSWHYLFSGEYISFRSSTSDLKDHKLKEIEFTFLDLLVQTPEGTIIYEGVLDEYEIDQYNNLKHVLLLEVDRRYLKDDNKNNKHYRIPGHSLLIPSHQIININFTYFGMKIDPETREVDLYRIS